MNTFMPHPCFVASAKVLDWQRLGKQRVECLQLIKAISQGGGWSNHPAAVMWRRYLPALALYGQCCIIEWRRRGYQNNMDLTPFIGNPSKVEMPYWLGDERVHASHRSNLLRKKPDHYAQFKWDEPPGLEYFWPAELPSMVC